MEDNIMFGCGTVDMKSGLAVYLHTFAQLAADKDLSHDLTLIAYEGEEVATEFNGLGHLQRSEEHTSELQSRGHLVCRLLLEKKNKNNISAGVQIARQGQRASAPHTATACE